MRLSGLAMILLAIALQVPEVRRPAAILLALQIVPLTYVGHRFWTMPPGPERGGHRINFLKNITLVGACLVIAGL